MQPLTSARLKLAVCGAVQGVGFRPFVYRLATEHRLTGWVRNSPQGVFIEAEGPRLELEKFLFRLQAEPPPRSSIQNLETLWLNIAGYHGFEIRESETAGNKTALVLPDIATCPDCLREIFDPANRRYLYPFTNCTHCGPRFTIIESLPYDRANTSMKNFTMCPQCRREYDDPADRRFHAQPNACPQCGPRLELWEANAVVSTAHSPLAHGDIALRVAAQAIRRGKIAAVKGIGGFHLMVDARNHEAVARLRLRKHREEKPFALLFPSLLSARAVCRISPLEERLLLSPEAPIVLLEKNENARSQIADSVAPGNPNLGVMLPSHPLHHLLLAELNFPLVATSGNLSDEPICTDEWEALECLGPIADLFLVHNRPIVRHVDDSVMRVVLGREMMLRRARGHAPLPIQISLNQSNRSAFQDADRPFSLSQRERAGALASKASAISCVVHLWENRSIEDPLQANGNQSKTPSCLAVGGHLKNSVALAVGSRVFISQHIGDLETEKANHAFRRVVADFQKLYDVKPETLAADLHPDYLSTKFACTTGIPAFRVQHHVAHVLSCMADNEIEPPALGVAWDGTGFGTDGSIWGGEFFLVAGKEVRRVATIRPFPLPGADAAIREPRRAALGLLYEIFGEAVFAMAQLPVFQKLSAPELRACKTMLQRRLHSPLTSSVGRLFDAVAAIIGLRQTSHFEGQTAMELEFAIAQIKTGDAYPLNFAAQPAMMQFDWQPMVEAILSDVTNNISPGLISAKFHNTLAEVIVEIAKRRQEPRVVLSGGCFQNRYLLERTIVRLRHENFLPFWHHRVPTNDGGIALGQVVAAVQGQQLANA